VTEGAQQKVRRRERRKAAKRERVERTGDSPEKRAERDRDVKDAASGAAIRGSVSAPPGIGGIGGGGI
jgi:hypothetical protein